MNFAKTKNERLQRKKEKKKLNKVIATFKKDVAILFKIYSFAFNCNQKKFYVQINVICNEKLENLPNIDSVKDFNSELQYYKNLHKVYKAYLNKAFHVILIYHRHIINTHNYENENDMKKRLQSMLNENTLYRDIRNVLERKGLIYQWAKKNAQINF